MTTSYLDLAPQSERKQQWFEAVRSHIGEVMNPDGTPRIPQFNSRSREPLWIAPALYTGTQAHIDMINGAISRWHDIPPDREGQKSGENLSQDFDIFRSTTMIHLYHRFAEKITPAAEKVMRVHIGHGTQTFYGSGQPDTKFHGANDNMPMLATCGLIFAAEILGDKDTLEQGWWYLNECRLLLSRSAWMSEFNSSTYSAVTIAGAASLATHARTPEVRALALEIEHRLWAELLLHYHPPTFMQAGPQSRAYAIDYPGHTHSLQFLFWLVFGPKITGRDPMRSYFAPDGREVIHFNGCPMQTVAEYVHFIDHDFHVPVELGPLAEGRSYPARHAGRSEAMGVYEGRSAVYHTRTYMEKEFSLGTVNVPMCNQTSNLHITYQRKPQSADFRDAASVFTNYLASNKTYGTMQKSDCGQFEGEEFIANDGWPYAIQNENVGLILIGPSPAKGPLETESMHYDIVFPAHYGGITRAIIGQASARDGAVGESVEVVPISIETGEVFIHVQPLLPTNLPRTAAVRFVAPNDRYQVLQLINYEGPKRTFTREQLQLVANGAVITADAKKKYTSLEEFHRAKSQARIVDYLLFHLRFVEFIRNDVTFRVTYSPNSPSAQTEAVDGRAIAKPVFESNQLDVAKLPFVSGPVEPNIPMFRWNDSMEVRWYPKPSWIIGSRGLPDEASYSRRVEKIKV